MTILDFATTHYSTPSRIARPGVAVIQLHDELWRVTRSSGEVVGYIERFVERGDYRYRAKRMLVLQKRFVSIGEFWRMDDALNVLTP
ncbi:hypothetical protein EYE40_06870 [Glaciihabitans arcticus]|uniref:DNA mismatch repair protein n=1 Tax=Glaciihabitans arcticus TaxID=2668039 RepID=A0A4Q9GQJ5_9MICO|nr:hypothetical protein [Glaciihabitans arcticus]TBN57146.1 hypothetical protein EYE40_06870 [Glaciihabitans arcticus]